MNCLHLRTWGSAFSDQPFLNFTVELQRQAVEELEDKKIYKPTFHGIQQNLRPCKWLSITCSWTHTDTFYLLKTKHENPSHELPQTQP